MGIICVNGYVCNLKRFNNDDGSIRLYFSISSKTEDPKRWQEKTERDFWNVDLYIPSGRSKLADYILEGKVVSVGGVPYKSYKKEGTNAQGQPGKREFMNIRGSVDMLQLLPNSNTTQNNAGNNGNGQPAAAVNQNQNYQQPAGNGQAAGNTPVNNQPAAGVKPTSEGW